MHPYFKMLLPRRRCLAILYKGGMGQRGREKVVDRVRGRVIEGGEATEKVLGQGGGKGRGRRKG